MDETPKPDRTASLKKQYGTLLTSLLTDHKSYLARIRRQREVSSVKLEDLITRYARLETVVAEGTKELIKERRAKQALEVRVEEMQTSIEQRIQVLRRRLEQSHRQPSTDSPEITRLKSENEQLRATIIDMKVPLHLLSDVRIA